MSAPALATLIKDHGPLPEATNDPLALIKAARRGVAKTWREPGDRPWRFSKAGGITTDPMLLVASPRALIGRLDRRTWSTKFEMRTPRDTTQVGELPIAVAG